MNDQDMAILLVCAQITGEILTGRIRLQSETCVSGRLSDTIIEEPRMWNEQLDE